VNSRFFTTEALVIGSMRYREADRILTFYTRDRGRLSAIAKGVRRTTSKVGGRLEPFSLVRVSLHTGRGSLYTVVGVDTLRTFQGVRDELFRMEEGARLLAVVRHLFPAEEANTPVFNLLVRAVARLAESPDPRTAACVVLATRLKLLALLGYAPAVASCAQCGSEGPLQAFSPQLGGALCAACSEQALSACFGVSAQALGALRVLVVSPLAELSELGLDHTALAEVEQIVTQTLAYHGH
jgi:DNA repair protein RecO (recombination protein O)